jgi:type II secretory pathway pseudopilin PulG
MLSGSVSTRGMSLVEAGLVVAVIAVLSLILIPPVNEAQQSFGLTAAALQVRTELHRARILAITRNQDCRLRVTSPRSYLIECQTPDWIPIAFHDLPESYTVAANNRPEFHPLGNVGPMATITVSDAAGRRMRLIVSRSGRIRME